MDIFFLKDRKGVIFKGKNGISLKHFGGKEIFFFERKLFLRSSTSKEIVKKKLKGLRYGVQNGYFAELEFLGLGYRFIKLGNYLLMKVGHSHYAKLMIPKEIHVLGYKKRLIFFGLKETTVKRFIYHVRKLREPNIYKGKGILLKGEQIKLKMGKQK